MTRRLELHELLCSLLGSRNVYFQPPPTVKMKYDCIVYHLDDVDVKHADDTGYIKNKKYSVTYISKDPDSTLWESILELPSCSFNRFYTADNLNHWVLTLYF